MPAATLTLTTGSTVYNLWTLIQSRHPNAEGSCRELQVRWDPGNSAAKVYIGGNDVATDNFGQQITATDWVVYRSDRNNIPLGDFALLSDTSGAKVDVVWLYA